MLKTDKGTFADVTDAAKSDGADDDLPARFSCSVTVGQSPEDLYAFWSDFTNLPKFMENVLSVSSTGPRRTHWVVQGPAGEVEWDAELTEDRPGALLAWKSVGDADIDNEGRVEFRPAPGDRGTEVRTFIRFKPPMGAAGRVIAALKQRDPHMQARRDLRRFKQLMETGEVSTAVGPNVPPPKS